ncbi:MAG: shikimate dehydrogenase [Methanomassiliicoccales archaeon]|nr:MAG: shikimate dehydrogenase [Methanomassiliicoccales archaeon]
METKTKKKKICGIIGFPLGHTLSPAMHNAAFSKLKLDYEYLTYEVSEDGLGHLLDSLKDKNFRGLSVTHPYKIKIMDYLDEIHELAHEIGAVNTIVYEQKELIGYNTDSFGAIKTLRSHGIQLDSSRKRILILGAGGAARAAAIPLAKMGNDIIVANRTYQRGEELTSILQKYSEAKALKIQEIPGVIDKIDIIINATCVGMKGGPKGIPLPEELLSKDKIVFDMVYSPKNTPLVLAATRKGAIVIPGYEMLVSQGALAFELWTGIGAPVSVMLDIVMKELDA